MVVNTYNLNLGQEYYCNFEAILYYTRLQSEILPPSTIKRLNIVQNDRLSSELNLCCFCLSFFFKPKYSQPSVYRVATSLN